jgi:hypothetical protein
MSGTTTLSVDGAPATVETLVNLSTTEATTAAAKPGERCMCSEPEFSSSDEEDDDNNEENESGESSEEDEEEEGEES